MNNLGCVKLLCRLAASSHDLPQKKNRARPVLSVHSLAELSHERTNATSIDENRPRDNGE